MGRLIEPVIAPLGFDWKMGIGIISSFAAREVFVSTMSTVYNLGKRADSEADHAEPGQNPARTKAARRHARLHRA